MIARRRICVRGVVQGIGFRPFVYRLAREQGLTGSVRNDGTGVGIELQGEPPDLDAFERCLRIDLPPGGRIESARVDPEPIIRDELEFTIDCSSDTEARSSSLAPDRFVCGDCLRELADPGDRRYRYPFINCTRCGPRFTIVRDMPYDRARTTMEPFEMCELCRREYEDPGDRRFHAEPVACPACGPRVWLVEAGEERSANDLVEEGDPAAAVEEAGSRLGAGQVLAIKGIGGFHLAVDARSGEGVAQLRRIKSRWRKPFALMARDLEVARRLVQLTSDDEQLLASPAAPIVLAPRREGVDVASGVAPDLVDLGVMLPYTPLHHLLLQFGPEVLVMTSGNPPGEPIVTANDEATALLWSDAYLLHDREICVANDDSVARTSASGPVFLRRSRGYVPEPIVAAQLPDRQVLALGASLKVTVATLSSGELVVGRHLGDLDNARTEQALRAEVRRVLEIGRVAPELIAVDLHPDFPSVIYAEQEWAGTPIAEVQHHHAHLAAVLVEHGIDSGACVVGIVLDGFGHGTDGAIWGGEVLCGGYLDFERVAHLRYVAQPGGDRAAVEPARMATSLLVDAELGADAWPGFDPRIAAICGSEGVAPRTSSAGRLFDGAAAILGLAPVRQEYEGEAASLLEVAADPACDDAYCLPVDMGILDSRELIRSLVEDRSSVAVRAARLINGLADGFARAALERGVGQVALGGGCMVNRLLLARLLAKLRGAGADVLLPQRLPPGDGGVSAGQAAVAACAAQGGG
ncbi:MAG: carbamoyltransferase HypF [Deltaproteobacteria bacterium]|nr:carbamoyltransferase HypF [Deltaproteobacteria bacterium]